MKLFSKNNRSHSLMFRVFLITFVIIFAAFLLVSFYSGSTLYSNSFDDAKNYSFQLFEQISINISNYMSAMENIATVSSMQSDVLNFLLTTASTDTNFSVYYELMDSIRLFLINLCSAQDNIECVTIIADRHEYYANNSTAPLLTSYDFRNEDWYKNALKTPEKASFLPPHIPAYLLGAEHPVISYLKPIIVTPGVPPVGLVLIDLNIDSLAAVCNDISLGGNGYSYIINSKGEYIYYPDTDFPLNEDVPYPDHVYTDAILSGNSSFTANNSNGVKNVVFSKSVPKTDWYVVGVVPYAQLNAPAITLRRTQIFLGIIVAAVVSALLSFFINSNVFKRLFKLKNHMSYIKSGNFDVKFDTGANDEIGELGGGFNRMTAQIKQLISDVSTTENQKRLAEFAALQAQINPHFLYNTLDSIVWMAEANPAGASEMAYMLASFFRLSLSRGADIVPLSQELEHTDTYLHIQKIRYENYFNYEIHVTADVQDFNVPKLIIQPLVENAIYHGIKPSGKKCTLFVYAFRYKNYVLIEVADDGIGILPDELNRILKGEHISDNSLSGVGVKNVDERIKLYFSKYSGLYFRSNYGHGTVACIYIYDKKH
ncbi:MAG: sensor histidine kinase [Christensenella sp.]